MRNKILLACLLCILTFLASCSNNSKKLSSADSFVNTVTDSVVIKNNIGNFRYVAEVPNSDNKLLQTIVSEWISEKLGGYYKGSYDSIAPILRLAADSAIAYNKGIIDEYGEFEGDEVSEFTAKFSKIADSRNYVTWSYEGYQYTAGGAHGYSPSLGQTFRKSDGRRIGWDVFRKTDEEGFQNILKSGLKQYLRTNSDEELRSDFLNEDDYYLIPLPQCPPLFTSEGVKFIYGQYEIMSYAMGIPTFVISYDTLRPYMTETALKLIE